MFEPSTLPLDHVSGVGSAFALFFALLIGHAIADFPLQGDFLSHGKNRKLDPPKLADGKAPTTTWIYLMTAHALIHAGFVWLISGYLIFALIEFVLHWLIDVAKCEGKTSFALDQWLHVITKAVYVVILWSGIMNQ
ncbi:DUF3307 domain-containing protein [Verrucomicrobiales bacterium BCK34]|nr:DUF3307 domain-containing protein [Verrucomicrobiales bacterium BCK34]